MKLITVENYEQLSELAAEIICDVVRRNPSATLGLATGSTVVGAYAHLCKMHVFGDVSFSKVTTVNLDEYVGLSPDSPDSYAYFMRTHLFDKVDIDVANAHIPCGVALNLAAECKRYDDMLDKLPRDLQLLGLGSNGHVAFNEPGSPWDSRTRVVQLNDSTVRDNSRLFARLQDVPTRAITMGIADIVSAKQVVLVASGLNKAQAVKALVQGKVSVDCPASILQRHPNATVIVDKLAASLL